MNNIRHCFAAIAVLVFLGSAALQAQTVKPPAENKPATIITRAIEVKNTDPNQLDYTLRAIAKVKGVVVTVDTKNKLLLLTGEPDTLTEMESLIRRLDTAPVPEKDIEITVYLLTAGETAGPSQEIPPQLEPVLQQLRSTFTYKSYQLLDTIFVRNRSGAEVRTDGSLPRSAPDGQPGSYTLMYDRSYLTRDEKVDVIHLSRLVLSVSSSSSEVGRGGGRGGSISTDIDLRSGQMVVVGKTTIGQSALIAVINARVVN